MKRTALIVDDEREARQRLARLLAAHPDRIEVAGEAADGPSAVEAVTRIQPDILFLDVQMPGLNGFQVLDSIPRSSWPLVVFTTAYDAYAVKAFEVHAVDYLLKPITRERLAATLDRLGALDPREQHGKIELVRPAGRWIERLMGRSGNKVVLLNVTEVIVFESEDKLVFARTASGRANLTLTMKELEERLNPEAFCRIHKQTIVQMRHARELHAMPGGSAVLKLSDGSQAEIGRKYSTAFRARFR